MIKLPEAQLRLIKLWFLFDFRFEFTYTPPDAPRWAGANGGNHGRNSSHGRDVAHWKTDTFLGVRLTLEIGT